MDYLTELKRDNHQIHERLDSELDEQFDTALAPMNAALEEDRTILKEYLAKPGRGIGGSLVLRMAGIHSPNYPYETALRVAAATELQTAGMLVIDDWIDGSAHRKGQPTVHERYRAIESRRDVADARAVQLGMAAITIAGAIAMKGEYRGKTQIVSALQRNQLRVLAGTLTESALPNRPELHDSKAILSMYEQKTGTYSFGGPIETGLLLAGEPAAIEPFGKVASDLGKGFQLQDDMIGLTGDPQKTGKPNTDDIRGGVHTALYEFARKSLNDTAAKRLTELYGKPGMSDGEIEECRTIMRESGGVSVAAPWLKYNYFDNARASLRRLWKPSWNPETRQYLDSMINFFWK